MTQQAYELFKGLFEPLEMDLELHPNVGLYYFGVAMDRWEEEK